MNTAKTQLAPPSYAAQDSKSSYGIHNHLTNTAADIRIIQPSNTSFVNTFWWEVGFALCFMGPVHHQVTKAAKA